MSGSVQGSFFAHFDAEKVRGEVPQEIPRVIYYIIVPLMLRASDTDNHLKTREEQQAQASNAGLLIKKQQLILVFN